MKVLRFKTYYFKVALQEAEEDAQTEAEREEDELVEGETK